MDGDDSIDSSDNNVDYVSSDGERNTVSIYGVDNSGVNRGDISGVPVEIPETPEATTQVYEVTAYTAGAESTGKSTGDPGYGVTASGAYVQEGRTIACPPSLDFGTVVIIEGLGERVCEDRGSAITEGRLDVYFDDLADAIEFGRQDVKVQIVNE